MSILEYHHRPFVPFDATNKNHRKWFSDFQKNKTWGKCPVRFIITDDAGDLLTMIQQRLIRYYVDKEFTSKVPPSKPFKKSSKIQLITSRNEKAALSH